MKTLHNMLLVVSLCVVALIFYTCGGGGSPPIDNIPIDNAPHIIEFTQPSTYADGSPMSVPSTIGGYYLYICHVADGVMVDNMVWVAEINTSTNPLIYDNDAWNGRWDILDILKSSPELVGTRPDDTHAFALRAISAIPTSDGKPSLSPFSIPWVYGLNPYALDNTQIPQEGDPYAQHPSGTINMLFNIGGGNN